MVGLMATHVSLYTYMLVITTSPNLFLRWILKPCALKCPAKVFWPADGNDFTKLPTTSSKSLSLMSSKLSVLSSSKCNIRLRIVRAEQP